jgi:hypothetical protein
MVNSGSKTSKVFKQSNKTIKDKNNIMNIVFKDINDDYAWAKYGDFKVIIMKENGYINATHLVHLASKNKKLNDWSRGKSSQELINEIKSSTENPADDLLIPITGGKITEIRGTYAHPDLIPHIASWASPTFAVRVSKIVNKYFIKKALKEKEKLIKKKDDKIDTLIKKIDKQSSTIGKMDNRIKRLLTKNDELYEQNEEILGKVDVISNDRVVTTGSETDEHMLVIIKNNDDPEEYDEDTLLYEYHVLRVMKKSYKSRVMLGSIAPSITCRFTDKVISHKERHPTMKVIMKINYSPNAMNLWTRIKKKLGTGKNKTINIENCKVPSKAEDLTCRFADKVNLI